MLEQGVRGEPTSEGIKHSLALLASCGVGAGAGAGVGGGPPACACMDAMGNLKLIILQV